MWPGGCNFELTRIVSRIGFITAVFSYDHHMWVWRYFQHFEHSLLDRQRLAGSQDTSVHTMCSDTTEAVKDSLPRPDELRTPHKQGHPLQHQLKLQQEHTEGIHTSQRYYPAPLHHTTLLQAC